MTMKVFNMETNKDFQERMARINREILTNVGKSQTALYGLSDERRKDIISLLAHWVVLAEDKLETKYRELAKLEKFGTTDVNPMDYNLDDISPYEYMQSHNVDFYGELEAEVEKMWQRRVKLDKENE